MLLIQLERFEGPLGLLLHLIRKEEMDIFDIDINQITTQYLDYIKAMKRLDLELAGDFVAMAATLIHIKSKMLLPQYNENGEEIIDADPRQELVQKLLEYQKFQDAAKNLNKRPLLNRDVFLRGERLNLDPEKDGEIIIEEENALFALISAYRHAIKNVKTGVHKVVSALQSISERIMEMKDKLIPGHRVMFSQLITAYGPDTGRPDTGRSGQVLVTFLSLLELAKIGFVSLFQAENFSEIHIDTKKPIERDVLERVESYDANAQAAAALEAPVAAAVTAPPEVSLAESAEDDFENDEAPLEQWAVQTQKVKEEEFIVEAATDEEILAEEERLMALDQQPVPSEEGSNGQEA